ncbi:MAG: gamma-glutamyltransferase [Deltaproteobacteria bacterium]|jgi:gamma-glutamyltranspeptidase/glutathione hydrolase|nr:gamma-glutamyltransferase [Deltaproteobacteria bacterium]MBW2535677.1 gamma-glutamyltransferase [Deltaproteobacteria bacterium]
MDAAPRNSVLWVLALVCAAAACEPSPRGRTSGPDQPGVITSGSTAPATPLDASAVPSSAPSAVSSARPQRPAIEGVAASPYPLPAPTPAGPVPEPPIELAPGGEQAVASRTGLVSSVEPHATRAGVAMLERGGNAIDAAVATAYALSVTHPQAGPLGGGGFMLIRLASGQTVAVDYREICPAAANQETNEKMLAKGAHGYGSAPVPGVVAGLNLALRRFGTRPLREVIAPAIELAEEGHPLGPRQSQVLAWYWKRLSEDPTFKAIFGRGDEPVTRGAKLRQRSLAKTLKAIAEHGDAGFYQGDVAERIDEAMRRRGGYVTKADLASYRAVLREPLRFAYRGFEIHTMPPPSMGGIALASMMLGLEQARIYEAQAGSADSLHGFAEAARRAYADRRSVAADPAFVDAQLVGPRLARLLDPRYYGSRKPPYDPKRATPSDALTPLAKAMPQRAESRETTHFAVVDSAGNAVACTTTLSAGFGAFVVPPTTGVILSNALGAFSPAGINAIAPGKRMASSMTPAIVLKQGQVVALLGSPGGDTIPNTVAQVLRNLVDHRMTVDAAVEAGRLHHQWKPDQLRVEKARPPEPAVLLELERRGHRIVKYIPQGDANAIVIDRATRTAYGFADTRQGGLALGAAPSKHAD